MHFVSVLNLYFDILHLNRLEETVYYATVKTLIFHKHFIILAKCKEENSHINI